MKQVTQDLKTGESTLVDVPLAKNKPGHLLIQTCASLISAGTERMLVDFGKSSYIQKAKQQPDKVKEVMQKVKTDGLMTTYEAVKAKLDQPLPMGYCNVGRVIAVGEGVEGFKEGDLVASNGPHAEFVSVPKNLCAKVPANVSENDAVFTVLGAIALQSVRLIKPELGETVVVSGLGLVGLMAVQLLRSHGCRVIGLDFNAERLALAKKYGADIVNLAKIDDPVAAVKSLITQNGVDAVLIAASTKSNDPVSQAANMCRQRGRIVLVGVTGLELSRADFYEKELTFQVSCSYGPGRYDKNYEQKGQDYPFGFVRWTEQRNFEAILHAMAEGWLRVDDLITNTYPVDEAKKAYETLLNDKSALGIILEYPNQAIPDSAAQKNMQTVNIASDNQAATKDKVTVSFIGAGNYASRMLIPAFQKSGVVLDSIYTNTGLNCKTVATKFNFNKASTDLDLLWQNNDDIVAIATPHNSHAKLVCQSLAANKHVFVEKPLALTLEELDQIQQAYNEANGQSKVMVGFNRRFSPYIQKMKQLLDATPALKSINMTINAGHIPSDHWTQDKQIGGGRIVGEACHFIDLARYLAAAPIVDSNIMYMGGNENNDFDTAVISLKFADGSIASINYLANGNKGISKERIEVFSAGKVLQLDNFRKLKGFGFKGFSKMKSHKQDKGQTQCVSQFVEAVQNAKPCPTPFDEVMEVSKVAVELADKR